MNGTNGFVPFAYGSGANVLSDSAYQSATATGGTFVNGVVQGQASSQQANKSWRQGTLMAAVLGQIIADYGQDANDSQTVAVLEANLLAAIRNGLATSSQLATGISEATQLWTWYTTSTAITVPSWATRCEFEITGGGGGGAGCQASSTSQSYSGGGGGAGATVFGALAVTGGASVNVVIGAGGSGGSGSGSPGGGGGASSVYLGSSLIVTAGGGLGANWAAVTTSAGAGGGAPSAAGNTAYLGGQGFNGASGGDGQAGINQLSGYGGSSFWGGGNRAGSGGGLGAVTPGSGGGGGYDQGTHGSSYSGGSGYSGIARVRFLP